MYAKFLGGNFIDIGDVIEVSNLDCKGTVVVEEKDKASKEVWVTGLSEKGSIKIFIQPDGTLEKIHVTGDTRVSDTVEYLFQPNGHLSDSHVIRPGMQR